MATSEGCFWCGLEVPKGRKRWEGRQQFCSEDHAERQRVADEVMREVNKIARQQKKADSGADTFYQRDWKRDYQRRKERGTA